MTNTLNIRDASVDDLPDIVALLVADALGRQREASSLPLDARYLKAFKAVQQDANQRLLVGVIDARVMACLQLSFIPGLSRLGAWRGQIESVRISSDYRGQGLGHVIFQWAIEACRERGCSLIQLTTDKRRADATRFYESLGFVASHEGMKLDLNN